LWGVLRWPELPQIKVLVLYLFIINISLNFI
jgi:hypothetical protein